MLMIRTFQAVVLTLEGVKWFRPPFLSCGYLGPHATSTVLVQFKKKVERYGNPVTLLMFEVLPYHFWRSGFIILSRTGSGILNDGVKKKHIVGPVMGFITPD